MVSSGWIVASDEATASAVRIEVDAATLAMYPFNPDIFAPPDPSPAPPIVVALVDVVGLDQLGADVIQPLVEFTLANGETHRLRTTAKFLDEIVAALEASRTGDAPDDDLDDADLDDDDLDAFLEPAKVVRQGRSVEPLSPASELASSTGPSSTPEPIDVASLAELPEVPPPSSSTSKRALQGEIEALRTYIAAMGVAQRSALRSDVTALTSAVERLTEHRAEVFEQVRAATAELRDLRNDYVEVAREGRLQLLGAFRFERPVDHVVPPSDELVEVRRRIERRLLDDAAIRVRPDRASSAASQGASSRDLAMLLLRTYNAEADLVVRGLQPFDLTVASERLEAAAQAVLRLGSDLELAIDPDFHRLRLEELRLVAEQHAAADGTHSGASAPTSHF